MKIMKTKKGVYSISDENWKIISYNMSFHDSNTEELQNWLNEIDWDGIVEKLIYAYDNKYWFHNELDLDSKIDIWLDSKIMNMINELDINDIYSIWENWMSWDQDKIDIFKNEFIKHDVLKKLYEYHENDDYENAQSGKTLIWMITKEIDYENMSVWNFWKIVEKFWKSQSYWEWIYSFDWDEIDSIFNWTRCCFWFKWFTWCDGKKTFYNVITALILFQLIEHDISIEHYFNEWILGKNSTYFVKFNTENDQIWNYIYNVSSWENHRIRALVIYNSAFKNNFEELNSLWFHRIEELKYVNYSIIDIDDKYIQDLYA